MVLLGTLTGASLALLSWQTCAKKIPPHPYTPPTGWTGNRTELWCFCCVNIGTTYVDSWGRWSFPRCCCPDLVILRGQSFLVWADRTGAWFRSRCCRISFFDWTFCVGSCFCSVCFVFLSAWKSPLAQEQFLCVGPPSVNHLNRVVQEYKNAILKKLLSIFLKIFSHQPVTHQRPCRVRSPKLPFLLKVLSLNTGRLPRPRLTAAPEIFDISRNITSHVAVEWH